MTKINRMVMHGFKSFARRTEMIFSDQFNCVLGPNGSGKSNILDALCFVLGKSSAKGLRAEKSANLIYNGGKSKNPAKAGKVSIYFDNSNKIFPLESDEIKVTRIITKSGQSKYRINDLTSTRQQIRDLLSVARIDPDGYNIILQGDIIRLIEMTPSERRGVIEEISGISIYEEKKNKAMNELSKVEGKLSEADIIMKERKTYLRELKKDRDQALKYKDLNDRIRSNKASFLKINIDQKNISLKGAESKMAKAKQEFDRKSSKIEEIKSAIKTHRDEVNEITRKVEEKGESENIKIQKVIESLRVDVATNKTRSASCDTEMLRIDQKKEQLQRNLSDIDQKIEEMEKERNKKDAKKTAMAREIETIQAKIRAFKKKHKIEEDSQAIDKEVEDVDTRAEELQKEIQEHREEQQNLLREKDKIEYQIQTIDEGMEKVKEIEKEHRKEIEGLKSRKEEFRKVTMQLNEVLDRSSSFSSDIASMESGLYKDKEELAKFKVRYAEKSEKAHGSLAVKKIIENKRKFGAVHGTVSELADVPSRYGLALEVAAGPRVRGVVVESDAVAAKCISYLRSNRLGIATFLPINRIRGFSISSAVRPFEKKQGALGFAVDLISCDKKFKKVFEFVFKDTLVVDSMENARKIGVGAIRMVTLKGDLIEQSGAMQGGFRAVNQSSFKDKELSGKIDELESRISGAEARIVSLEMDRKANEAKIIDLRARKASLEGEIIRVEKSLHLKSDDLEASISLKKQLEKKLSSIGKEADEVSTKVAGKNRDLANLKMKKQALKEKLSQIRNPLVLAELNTFDQRKDELNQDIMKLDSDIRGIDIQIKDIFKRDKDNTAKIIADLDREEKGFKEEKQLLKEKVLAQKKELKEKEALQAKFYSKFKKLFAKRSKINEEISRLENRQNNIDLESRKDEYSVNTITLEIARIKAELSGLEEDFAQYVGVKLDKKRSIEQLKKEIRDFERMKEGIGSVNMRALEIYEKVEKEYSSLIDKQKNLQKEKNDVLKLMDQIESKKSELFMKTFDAVESNFQDIFQKLSTKGKAYLDLENKENPFDGGLFIKVKLTGARYLDIRSLSGGEKTLTALAFIFAVQEHDPASFYVLDEVDAALDKHNSEKFARLIAKYADSSQYLIISHNDMVISHADSLYGVSMDNHGITKVMSLKI